MPGKDSSNARENAWVKAGLSCGNSPVVTDDELWLAIGSDIGVGELSHALEVS